MALVNFDAERSNAAVTGLLRQTAHLTHTLRRLAREPAAVVAEVEALRAALTQGTAVTNMVVHITCDVLAQSDAVAPWATALLSEADAASAAVATARAAAAGATTSTTATAADVSSVSGVSQQQQQRPALALARTLRTPEALQPHGRGLLVVSSNLETGAHYYTFNTTTALLTHTFLYILLCSTICMCSTICLHEHVISSSYLSHAHTQNNRSMLKCVVYAFIHVLQSALHTWC
jgi:hypothetical protein